MTAYAIFIRERITDAAEMEIYGQKAHASFGNTPPKPLVFYGPIETVEGPKADGAVVLEFADMEAARAWYHGPAYQDAMQHRLRGAEYRVMLTEGV